MKIELEDLENYQYIHIAFFNIPSVKSIKNVAGQPVAEMIMGVTPDPLSIFAEARNKDWVIQGRSVVNPFI